MSSVPSMGGFTARLVLKVHEARMSSNTNWSMGKFQLDLRGVRKIIIFYHDDQALEPVIQRGYGNLHLVDVHLGKYLTILIDLDLL